MFSKNFNRACLYLGIYSILIGSISIEAQEKKLNFLTNPESAVESAKLFSLSINLEVSSLLKISPTDGSILKTYKNYDGVWWDGGLAFDGEYIYYSLGSIVYRYSEAGTYIDSQDFGLDHIIGLACDSAGLYLWDNSALYRAVFPSGEKTQVPKISGYGTGGGGLSFGGSRGTLFITINGNTIRELNPISGNTINVLNFSLGKITGLGFSNALGILFVGVETSLNNYEVFAIDPDNGSILYPLNNGNWGLAADEAGSPILVPNIVVDKHSLTFGQQLLGYPDTLTVTISNQGSATLEIDSVNTTDPHFSVLQNTLSIPYNTSADLDVVYTGSENQSNSGTLQLFSNDTSNSLLSITLNGATVLPPKMNISPGSIDLVLKVGSSTTETILLDNSQGGLTLETEFWIENIVENQSSTQYDNNSSNSSAALSVGNYSAKSSDLSPPDILIIQDEDAWGINLQKLIFANYGLESDIISSDSLTNTLFSEYDLIITSKCPSSQCYQDLSASSDKFDQFLKGGGTIFFQVPSPWASIDLAGGIVKNYGNSELHNLGLDLTHPILGNIAGYITSDGTQASIGYLSNLPENTQVLTIGESSEKATTIDVPFSSGRIIATCMRWEYMFANGITAGDMLTNALEYAIGSIQPKWLIPESYSYVTSEGEISPFALTFSAENLVIGEYQANLIIKGNDPANKVDTIDVTLHVVNSTTGLEKNTPDPIFNFYPNPTNGVIHLNSNIADSKYLEFCIYDNLGQVIKEFKLSGSKESEIDLSDLLPGIYLIEVRTASQSTSESLIIK